MPYFETDFFSEKQKEREYFLPTLERLLKKIKNDRATRHGILAGKDIKLLRTTEAAVAYLHSIYDNEFRICLSQPVIDYITRMDDCLNRNQMIQDEECTSDKFYLSICDVEIVLKETNDIIYFLVVEFDPMAYQKKKSLMTMIKASFYRGFPQLKKTTFPNKLSVPDQKNFIDYEKMRVDLKEKAF